MKRVFSLLLVLLLVVGLVPVQAFASYGPWDVWAYYGDYEYVTVSHTQANPGEMVTVTPLDGYRLTRLEVYMGEAEQVPATHNGTSGSFTMPDSPVEIWVEVASTSGGGAPHSINLLSAGGGTPTADKYAATAGQTVTITPNPDAGNVFTKIQIDYYRTDGYNEIYYLNDGVTSFVMPDNIGHGGTVKVVVYYDRDPNAGPITHPLEVMFYTYGPGSGSAPETAVPGSTVTFTAIPDEGCKADVTVYNAANTSITFDYTRISQTEYQFTMQEDIPYIFVMFTEGEDDYIPGGGDEPGAPTATPAPRHSVTFDANGGSCATASAQVNAQNKLASLPTATFSNHFFVGWFLTNGEKVTLNTVFTEDTTVRARWVSASHTTDPDDNDYSADIAMEDQDVLNKVLTANDLASNENITVWLEVNEMEETETPAEEKTSILTMAGEDEIAAYLDISLFKKIGDSAKEKIHNTNGKILISMQLSDELIPENAKRDSFYIIYYHNGAAHKLDATFNTSTKTLTFLADEFSTYSLAYKTHSSVPPVAVPKTGDESNVILWSALAFISLLSMTMIVRKRKEA